MGKIYHWQQKIIDHYSNISNEDLLGEVIAWAAGDDWDGDFTDHGWWEFNYAKSLLHERLADWLTSDKNPATEASDNLYILRNGIYNEAPEM